MKFTKEEKSWILYDWANSAYITIIVAAIFPIYFTGVAQAAGQSGDMLWAIGTSIATTVIAICSPIIGSLADYQGFKKKIFTFFLLIGLLFTIICAISNNYQWLLFGYIISHIGYSGSCVIYDGFIVDVTNENRIDQVSSWGYALGYIGGSTIPFLLSIALVTFGESIGIDSILAVKYSVVICILWWGLFSIPFLKNVKQKYGIERGQESIVKNTLQSLFNTFKEMIKNKAILFFLLAYFFYIDGVNTVINMATAYGTTLGLSSTGMILALLVTQLVAFPCAILFGKLSKKYNPINLLLFSVAMYFVICIIGFIMGFGIEEEFLSLGHATTLFWILSVLVGTVQGGIQALSRSFYGKMVPKNKAAEYFGVYDIFGKFAAIMGPAIYAIVKSSTGRSSLAILAIIGLFLIGGILLIVGRKYFEEAKQ